MAGWLGKLLFRDEGTEETDVVILARGSVLTVVRTTGGSHPTTIERFGIRSAVVPTVVGLPLVFMTLVVT